MTDYHHRMHHVIAIRKKDWLLKLAFGDGNSTYISRFRKRCGGDVYRGRSGNRRVKYFQIGKVMPVQVLQPLRSRQNLAFRGAPINFNALTRRGGLQDMIARHEDIGVYKKRFPRDFFSVVRISTLSIGDLTELSFRQKG